MLFLQAEEYKVHILPKEFKGPVTNYFNWDLAELKEWYAISIWNESYAWTFYLAHSGSVRGKKFAMKFARENVPACISIHEVILPSDKEYEIILLTTFFRFPISTV